MIEVKTPPPPLRRKPPPLPPTEREFALRWYPAAVRAARRVRDVHRLGQGTDDLAQDLCETILKFRREWRRTRGREPDDKLISHALAWRAKKLARAAGTKGRRAVESIGELIETSSVLDEAEPLAQRDAEKLVVMLLDMLDPTVGELLWSNLVDGRSVRSLAAERGIRSTVIEQALAEAKADAIVFLRALR